MMGICFCASGCARNPMADPGVFGNDCSCWCHDRKPANPYEEACDRFNRASENYPKAKAEAERILREANDEYDAAQDNLRQYESQPGVALPEYREQVTTA